MARDQNYVKGKCEE